MRENMWCVIWYHLCNLKNMKNTHKELLLFLKFLASAWNFTKRNPPPWVLFTFFKLYKWYHIAQNISYDLKQDTYSMPQVFEAHYWKGLHSFFFTSHPKTMFWSEICLSSPQNLFWKIWMATSDLSLPRK